MITRRAFPSLLPALALLLAALGLLLGSGTASAQEASPGAVSSPTPDPAAGILRPPGESVQLGCENCHGDPAIAAKGAGLYVPESRVHDSVHTDLVCTDCHLQSMGVLHEDPEAEMAAALASCKDCHEAVVAQYETSSHGTAKDGPTCAHCHTAHSIQPADNRAFVIHAANALCADCHDSEGQSFFRDNYHGKEAALGRSDIAVCADCHTAHGVLPPSNPRSSVAPDNRVQTCARCHEGATQNFSDIEIHVKADPIPSDPKLAAATLYFIILLTLTFGLFGWHMILSIRYELRHPRAKAAAATPGPGGAGG